MNQRQKHFHSHHFIDKRTTERLVWYRWAETKSLAYLNIIDYQGKIEISETIPWDDIPCTKKEIQKYSQLTVYKAYKLFSFDEIAASNNSLVSGLIENLLHVCNLFNSILDLDRKIVLYNDLIHLLYEKQFVDSSSFLTLWNLLCGSSNELKINVLNNLIERRRDRKSINMLSYILDIAQAAQFNFWGVWFNEGEDYLYFCPVTLALLKGNLDLLILLLQYGFEQNPGRIGIYNKYYNDVHPSIYSWLIKPLEERNLDRRAIVNEVLMFLILITKVKARSKFASLKNIFCLLWSVNAIPFVTKSELVNEIYRRYQSPPRGLRWRFFPCTCEHFVSIVEDYDLVKPQGATNEILPRSLQQFCKYVIRKTLTRSYNLPQGIQKLPLPIKLQAFLHV